MGIEIKKKEAKNLTHSPSLLSRDIQYSLPFPHYDGIILKKEVKSVKCWEKLLDKYNPSIKDHGPSDKFITNN